ncbi:MAG: hypothetical protein RLZZ175_1684 [Bacteroidota bacterium]|jgi:hypothetical protein
MSEREKKSIDDIFKSSFESMPEETPSEMDWGNMRSLLQEEALIKPNRNKFLYLIPFAILFVSLTVYGIYNFVSTKNEQLTQNAKTVSEGIVNQNDNSVNKSISDSIENSNSLSYKQNKTNLNNETVNNRNSEENKESIKNSSSIANNENSISINSNDKVSNQKFEKSNFSTNIQTNNSSIKNNLPKESLNVSRNANKLAKTNNCGDNKHLTKKAPTDNKSRNSVYSNLQLNNKKITNNEIVYFDKSEKSVKNNKLVNDNILDNSKVSSNKSVSKNEFNSSKLNETSSSDITKISENKNIEKVTIADNKSVVNTELQTKAIDSKTVKQDSLPTKIDSFSANSVANKSTKKDSSDNKYIKKWAIGPYFSLNQAGYNLKSNDNFGSEILNSNSHNLSGKSNLNYSIGIQVSRELSEKLSVQFGVLYNQKTIVDADIKSIGLIKDSNNYSFNNYEYHFSGKNILTQLSLKYYFNTTKLRFYTLLGVQNQFNISGSDNYFKVESYSIQNSSAKTVSLSSKSIGVIGQISFGISYKLSDKINIYIEPTYRKDFMQVVRREEFDKLPVSHYTKPFGLGIGLFYDL